MTRHILGLIWACVITSVASAQLTVVQNSGCTADGSPPGELFAQGAQAPTLGNLTFAIEHVCPIGATASFFILGACEQTLPLPDIDLSDPCFNGWTTPVSCGQSWAQLYALDGALTTQGKVIWAFPLPNIPELVTFTQTTPLCVQFVCVDLVIGGQSQCVSISKGLSVVVQ